MRRSEIIHIITESIKRQLLNEGDSRLNKVMRIITNEFSGLLDINGTVTYSEYYVNNNPNTTWGQYLLYSLRHNFGLMTNNDVKYLPFVAKIAFSDEVGFEKRNNNGEQLNTLRTIVQAIKKDPELFNNLVNKGVDTYSELVNIMAPYLQKKEQEELDNINSKEYVLNTDYDIIEIHSYEEAHEIGEYSSLQDGRSKLCYTQSKSTWEQYTNNGNNRVFCLLKHGWKEMKPIAGEDAPYDEYGLSMIFIFFNKMGKITTCNTRWNHEYSEGLHSGMSVDHSLSAEELSEIIGGNIYEVLGINSVEATFGNVQALLDKGYKPKDIFDSVYGFYDGYAGVKLNGKWNWISADNRLVSPKQWFDKVDDFENGYAKARIGYTKYIVGINGNYVEVTLDNAQELLDSGKKPKDIFDEVHDFYDGYAPIELNDKWNWISKDNRLVSPNQWFDTCGYFYKGYVQARIDDTKYIVNTNGKIVLEVTFENVQELLDKGYNPYDIFDDFYYFVNGYSCVKLNRKYNWISTENRLVSNNQWFDYADDFENGYAEARIGYTWYKIDTNGQLYNYDTMQPIDLQSTTNMTLNELKHIIKESIKRQLLNEISIRDKYKKEQGRTKWNADEFQLICQSDPTYNMDKDIVGKYTNWLLNKLQNIEQLQQVRIPLEWYADGMKRGILQRSGVPTDINRFSNIEQFIETMNSVMHGDNNSQMSQSEYNNRKKLEGQFEIIGENADYEVIIPKTFDAERYFGSGTEWCTVANKNYFNSYTKKGNLYIFYPKNGDKKLKMQFHIETKSYATYDDEVYNKPSKCISSLYSVNEDKIKTTLALCQKVFKGKIPEVLMINVTFDNVQSLLDKGYKPKDIFDSVYGFYNDYERVKLNGKYNLISNDNRLISPNQWYDYIGNFIDGYARVQLNNKRNFIDTNGNYLSDQWFDVCYSFSNGYANVQLNNKWNYIDTNGKYLSEQWFDWVDDFNDGYVRVELNDKWNFIDTNGNYLSEQWFEGCANFYNGYALIKLNGKYNFIDTKCNYLSGQWFDYAWNFHDGYSLVEINSKYNWIDTNGTILSEQWFDYADNFYDSYARVKIGDTWYKIDTNGQLYDYDTIEPINQQNTTNMTLNELKHIIRETIKQKLNIC